MPSICCNAASNIRLASNLLTGGGGAGEFALAEADSAAISMFTNKFDIQNKYTTTTHTHTHQNKITYIFLCLSPCLHFDNGRTPHHKIIVVYRRTTDIKKDTCGLWFVRLQKPQIIDFINNYGIHTRTHIRLQDSAAEL